MVPAYDILAAPIPVGTFVVGIVVSLSLTTVW